MEGDDFFEQKTTESRSSINHGDLFGVPQLSEYELGRRKKQQYLIENIVQTGYDTTKFAGFMESKLGKIYLANFLLDDGVNIDNWTFDGLVVAVQDFITQEDKKASEVPVKFEEEIKS